MQRVKTDDEVMVIAGKSKGHHGKVIKITKDKEGKLAKVLVEGANMIKKHVKPNPNKGIEGGVIEREAVLDASNVVIYNPVTKKGDRVGVKTLEDGKKVRYFKSNGELIDI